MRKSKRTAQNPTVFGSEPFASSADRRRSLHFNKRKIFGWTASALALVTIPAVAFAWSVDSTHFPTPASNQAKPITKVSNTSADDNSNDVSESTPDDNNSQQTTTVDSDSSSTTNGSAQNNSSTHVTVNGQNVPVPTNGSTTQTVTGNGTPTDVSVTHQSTSSTSGSGTSQNNNHISIQTNSSSTKNIESDTPE